MYKCAQYTRMYMCLKVAPEGAFITVYITVASDKNILYFIDSIRGIATLLKNPPGAGPNIQAGGKRLIFRQTDSLVLRWKPDGIPDGKH